MLLTITTTHQPATDLGYLLHKNPSRAQSFNQSFGRAHVFYPQATETLCTAALLLDIDPVALVRGEGPHGGGGALDQYVNDRPYVARLVPERRDLALAAGRRRSREQPTAETPIPLRARIAVVPCRGGEPFLRALFEPLGYEIAVSEHSTPYLTVRRGGQEAARAAVAFVCTHPRTRRSEALLGRGR